MEMDIVSLARALSGNTRKAIYGGHGDALHLETVLLRA
jgi:hypothetical protein